MPFKDHFSKIAKTVSEGASSAAKKSSEMVEITKLTLSIQSHQDKIKTIKSEIGSKVYEKFENGVIIDQDVIDLCNDIKEIEESIKQINAKISLLKNSKTCVKCGAEILNSDVFCPKCGTKQEKIVDIVEINKIQEVDAAESEEKEE